MRKEKDSVKLYQMSKAEKDITVLYIAKEVVIIQWNN